MLYVFTKSLIRICSGPCFHVAIVIEDLRAECVPVLAWVCPTHIRYACCGESHVLLGGRVDLRVECAAMSGDRLFAFMQGYHTLSCMFHAHGESSLFLLTPQ